MAKTIEKQEARRLRSEGLSLKDIAEQLGVAKSSVSSWVRDVTLTNAQRQNLDERRSGTINRSVAGAAHNRETAQAQRLQQQQQGRLAACEGRLLHMMGCMLYWAEGAKLRNRIHFVNSDPNMIVLFARFLRDELMVHDDEFAVHIHCHTSDLAEIARIEAYWLTLLDLSPACLKKTYVKKGSDTRHNRLENGICTIVVHRTDLAMHVYGAIQEYAGFDNPDWLF
jgi:predicted transcriptional regulator